MSPSPPPLLVSLAARMPRPRWRGFGRRRESRAPAQADYARCLIDSSLDMIIAVDTGRRIIEFNRVAQETFGYRRDEVIGQHADLLYGERTVGEHIHRLTREQGRCVHEVVNRRRNGELFVSLLRASVLRDDDGEVVGVMAISRDITERKRDQERLREANRKLQEALRELQAAQLRNVQQERLHAIGQMASGIAHDFNNALSPIIGFTELLLFRPENLIDEAKARHYLELILMRAQDAGRVVARLREFYRTRTDSEEAAPVDLNLLVQRAIELTRPRWRDQALGRGCTINVRAELEPIAPIYGSETELREMIINLILNAIDGIAQDGDLILRTRMGDRRRGGRGAAAASPPPSPTGPKSFVLLEVEDTGVGMSEEVLAHCLEPFYSTKGENGTGLGLAIVYGTLQRHEGSLEIASELGRGTKFTLHLPAHRRGEDVAATARALPSRPRRILVVDDEPTVRDVVRELLLTDGHSVCEAASGPAALERFRAEPFDLVITDRAMPQMRGEQLAQELKRLNPKITIFMLTGFGDQMRLEGEQPAGVDLVLSKPASLDALREAMTRFDAT